MSRVLIASTIAASVVATNIHDRKFYEGKFFEWLQDFKENVQVRDGEHFVHMLQNFANNHDLIEQVNSQNLTYTLGHNAFSHMSHEEWVEYMRFGLAKDREHQDSDLIHEAAENEVLASAVDWVVANAVTGVKDQGNCGSCWSFSATGALEGVYKIKTGTLKSYSEQELVSCNNSPRTNHGCNGGLMDYAFQWVKDNGGLCTESAYPYTSGTTGQDGTCNSHTSCDDKTLKLTGYVDVKKNDDTALASAVSMNPTAVAIQANDPAFQLYKSGVLTGACGANLNHGVLAVGYGTDAAKGGDYWKIKNSWGTSWGEAGYIRIARGSSYNGGKGQCGIYSGPPSYPKM